MHQKLPSVSKRLLTFAGLDSHVMSTFLQRGWTSVAGAIMVILIPHWLDQVEQGYYFTFASLLALQVFFELGMSQVALQLASHEVALLRLQVNGHVEGGRSRLNELSKLTSMIQRWYVAASKVFCVVVGMGGAWFLAVSNYLPLSQWMGAWLLLILATSINLMLIGKLVIFEAFGDISGVAKLRLVQSILGMALMWAALAAGAKLWAIPLVPLIAAICTAYWLRIKATSLSALPNLDKENFFNKWYSEVLPLQWRFAVSWMSGFFIFQLFTPVAFASFGPVEAGQLGISIVIFGAISNLGLSWVTAKIPTMAACVARRDQAMLSKVFLTAFVRAALFTSVATFAVVAAIALTHEYEWPIADRLVPTSVATCIALSTLTNCIIFAFAAYMRAYKEEPMVWPSVVAAVATAVAVGLGSKFSVFAMMAGYSLVTTCISLPWATKLFIDYYRRPRQ